MLGNEGLSIFGDNRDSANIASMVGMLGSVFYVDGTGGVDTNTGRTKDAPLLTVTAALALCANDKGDVVQILRNSPSTPPATETFPIVCNKSNVIIRGLLGKGMLSDSGIGSDTANVPTFQIEANYVTIEDLYIGCDNAGSTSALVYFNGTRWGCALRRIQFDSQYSTAYGVYIPADCPYLLVEDCTFGRGDIASYTTGGIVTAHCTGGRFQRNVFTGGCTGVNILATTNVSNLAILDNRFSLYSDTEGMAITLPTGVGCVVDGNSAMYGKTAPATNPYKDAGTNDWGLNYSGGIAVMPVIN